MHDVERLSAVLEAARRILVFSGAGISTGSGIPDFRGPQGVWKTRQPVYFGEFMVSAKKRVEYWEYKVEAHDAFMSAKPNAAHGAVVRLEKAGRVKAVVTQNIDGLHQAAGSSAAKVIEIHGTNREIECTSCGAREEPARAVAVFRETQVCPTCAACGGFLKFATISFGQALNPETIERASQEAREADLVLALGSTLSVSPANQVPLVAARRGAPYIIVNRGETDHDDIATLKLDGDVVEILPAAVDALARER